jgi:coenzyme F420-reducing hydrogenase delta subunit/NAD-dependent dihydropyrimidine dehydrogenase PreA subunit
MTHIFLSRQNGSLASLADLARVQQSVPGVTLLNNFSRDENRESILAAAAGTDAIVLAGPEWSFYDTPEGRALIDGLVGAGINRNRIVVLELATILGGDVDAATETAIRLLDLAARDASSRKPFPVETVVPVRAVAVIGAAPAGILLAARLAADGIAVTVIGRGEIPAVRSEWVDREMAALGAAGAVLLPFATLKGFSGIPGRYTLEVEQRAGASRTVTCGSVAIATGADTPHNQEIHEILHIPVGGDKRLQAATSAADEFRTRHPQIVILPGDAGRDTLDVRLAAPAAHLAGFLGSPSHLHQFDIVTVDETVCGACGTCVKTCMFGASNIDTERRVSVVDRYRCVGCGNCVTACPTAARELLSYPSAALYEVSRVTAGIGTGRRVMVFACEGSGIPVIEGMKRLGREVPPGFVVSRIRCGARMDTQFISEAMNEGFAGVAVVVCKESACRNLIGSLDLSRRLNLYRAVLRARRMDANLLRIINMDRNDIEGCAGALASFAKIVGGTNP